jgi:teichuronic acid biosynthesis glycosyltransferase TuaC
MLNPYRKTNNMSANPQHRARRIALITPMLPVPHDQTRGRYIHETARCLSKLADVRVFFQQLRYPGVPLLRARSYLYARLPENYSLEGIAVEALEYPGLPVISRPLNSFVSARALVPRLRDFCPDVVLAYWLFPDSHAALVAAKRLGVPCVAGALGSDIHVRDTLNAWFTKRTITGVDALLTVSEHMRRTAIEQFGAAPDKVHTITNGYNTAVFYPRPQNLMRAKLGVPADVRLISYVGRFVLAKGLKDLTAAFTWLAAADPRLRMVWVGDGVMREELVGVLRGAGIEDRVILPGGLEPEQVAEWICASDVLCLPSWSEGYPNVVVEAIACGRPVVATDVGGTSEIIKEGTGILVSARNVESLRQGLERALTAHWDHTAIASSIRRTWDDVAAETLAVCERVMGDKTAMVCHEAAR